MTGSLGGGDSDGEQIHDLDIGESTVGMYSSSMLVVTCHPVYLQYEN